MSVNKVVTIEISDFETRLCEISYNSKHPKVYNSAEFKNPVRAVEDGFIVARVPYEGIFREQLGKAGIRCKDVVFTLASNKVFNREVNIPIMNEKLIGEYIENEKGNIFPMDTANHVLTYHVIETNTEEKQHRLMVYAAPDQLIRNYEIMAAEMGFKIAAIDYSGNSIYQWLHANRNQKIDLYLQINERNTMFTILDNDVLALQRNMNFGTGILIQNLIDSGFYGGIDEVEATLALAEKENIFSSFAEIVEFKIQGEEEQKIYELKRRITELLRPLVGNIARVLEYYNMKNREVKLMTVHVGGTGTKILGLKQLLENEFNGLEFVMIDSLPGLNISKNNHLFSVKSSAYTACIGAAIPSINFVKIDEKQKLKNSLVFSLVALGLVVIISGVIVLNGFLEYHDATKYRSKLTSRITELIPVETLEKNYLDLTQTLEEAKAMDTSVYRYNEDWNDIINYLESELPSDTVISSLSSNQDGLILNVTLNTKDEAAEFLLQLQNIPYFTSVSINGLVETIDPETQIKTVTFSVQCNYHEEVAAPTDSQNTAPQLTPEATEGEVTP
jgi:type IV pilus assembly protein PilN